MFINNFCEFTNVKFPNRIPISCIIFFSTCSIRLQFANTISKFTKLFYIILIINSLFYFGNFPSN